MNTLVFFALVTLSTASASIIGLGPLGLLHPVAPGVIVQGPSSQVALAGADGSAVASAVQGGTVATGGLLGHGILAAPAIAAPAIVAGPSGAIVTNGLSSAHVLAAPRLLVG